MAGAGIGVIAVLPTAVHAQSPAAAPDIDATLDAARAQLDKIKKRLDEAGDKPLRDADLAQLRSSAAAVQGKAEDAVAAIKPELASVKARVAELGVPSPDTPEAPDVAQQRAQLSKSSTKLDAQMKLAGLISVESGQAIEQVLRLRRSLFQAQLGQRRASVLLVSFWSELAREWPADAERLGPLWQELRHAAGSTTLPVWLAIGIAAAILLACRYALGKWLLRLSTTRVAPGRLRRSLYAVSRLLLATAIPGAVALLLRLGLTWQGQLGEDTTMLMNRVVGTVFLCSFVAGLGRALLAVDRPTWRLPPILDSIATGLRAFPLSLAVILVLGRTAEYVAARINASLATTVAVDWAMGMALALVMAQALQKTRLLRRAHQAASDAGSVRPYPVWMLVLLSTATLTLAFSLICLLSGWVALGSFVAKQLFWSGAVLASSYLLAVLVTDGCAAVVAAVKRNAGDPDASRPSTRARCQAAVLLAGLARVTIVLLALTLLLAPFGEGPSQWLQRLEQLRATGLAIGEIQLRPLTVLQAFAVLLLSLAVVKIVQRWLTTQYLPTTSLDPGMRISAGTLFGYAGYVLAAALAMSAAGIGLERVAWIASALSVGIGFGLQAVVQNFVSGLILLAERPVRVGDWVSLGGVEGDVRRINVRATEIQMGDHSTVIVPNSEFITKVVRNVTHANPIGRLQFKLTMPLSTDAQRLHDLLFDILAAHDDVLKEPAPSVSLDSIESQGLAFSVTAFVASPRIVGGVRSAVLFDVLARLREAGMPLAVPGTVLLAPAPQPGQDGPWPPQTSAFPPVNPSATRPGPA